MTADQMVYLTLWALFVLALLADILFAGGSRRRR